MADLQVLSMNDPNALNVVRGGRPLVNAKTKASDVPQINTPRGLKVNSILRKDEWEQLDTAVIEAAVQPLNVARILEGEGLTRSLGSIGILLAQYNRIGEMTDANISLRGHASGEKDLVDTDLAGVPIPIIFKEFEIDSRSLASSRLMSGGLDVTNGGAAARVVAEKIEDLILNGDTSINLNGNTIYGLTTHPDRNTDTATNYGGGDLGTITNVTPTIAGMIAAAQADGFYGPYGVIASNAQYNQAAFATFTDGSGNTPAQRVRQLGQGSMTQQIRFFEPSAQLTDGTIILFQLTKSVIELAKLDAYWPVTNMEWTSGDRMMNMFKVMTVFTPIVKSAYGGRSGIVIATGA